MVKVNYIGITHMLSFCSECDFSGAISIGSASERRRIQAGAREHVRVTGHRVTIEKGTVTKYTPNSERK